MSKLEARRGEAKQAFNGDRAGVPPKKTTGRSQGEHGPSPISSKPDFDKATKGHHSGPGTPTKKHEPPEHMKQQAKAELTPKPKRRTIRRRPSPGLSR